MSEENKNTDNRANNLRANEVRIGLTALALAVNPICGAVVGGLSLVDYISKGKIATVGKNFLDGVRSIASNLWKKISWSESKIPEKETVKGANEELTHKENKGCELDGINTQGSMKATTEGQKIDQGEKKDEKDVVGFHTARVLGRESEIKCGK